jgi:hypothetical protein
MDISIQERKFSFRSEYDIVAPNATYTATKSFFSFNDKLQLKTEDGHLLARINGYFSPLRSRHDSITTGPPPAVPGRQSMFDSFGRPSQKLQT